MKLNEAFDYLNTRGFIVEDTENSKGMSVERKINHAINYNIDNFYKGLENQFNKYWDNWTREARDYNFSISCQPVAYYFDDDNLIFEVNYFDEDGYIQLTFVDEKKNTSKSKKIMLNNKIDNLVLKVFNWFLFNVKNYDKRKW